MFIDQSGVTIDFIRWVCPMKRLLVALAVASAMPMAAWGGEAGFNNLRGASTCLRSIFYRAHCPAEWDDRCPGVWIASLRLCRDYRTRDRLAYRVAMAMWRNEWFFDDFERKHRIVCGEGERIARLRAEEEKAGNAHGGNPDGGTSGGPR